MTVTQTIAGPAGKAAATARDEVAMDRLADALLGVVEETMQPERMSLWLKQK